MARSIRPANGASPFFARPIQFEAMKPSSISPASSRSAFSMLAELDANTSTAANAGRRFEQDLERAALAVECAVALGSADADRHG